MRRTAVNIALFLISILLGMLLGGIVIEVCTGTGRRPAPGKRTVSVTAPAQIPGVIQ